MAIATSKLAVTAAVLYPLTVKRDSSTVENKNAWYYLSTKGAMSGWRDKNRFKTWASTGYLPQYSYSESLYVNSPGVSQNVVMNRYGEIWNTTSALGLPHFATSQGQITYTDLQPACEAKALSNLNSNVRNQYYSVVETFYEGKKTARMITKAASTTLRALKLIRKGNFLTAARTLGLKSAPKGASKGRSLEQNWLEYRYGWGPLYQTVYGEMKRTYDHMRTKPTRIYQKVGFAESATKIDTVYTGAYTQTVPESAWTPFFKWRVQATTSRSVKCQYKAIFEIHNPGVVASTELGLTNPALLAWEAIPLSFVADWFVNVSDCLAQLDCWAGKSYLTGTKSVTVRSLQTRTPDIVAVAPATMTSKKTSTWIGTYSRNDRTIVSSPPLVPLRFEVSLSVKRVADGVALLKQFFK